MKWIIILSGCSVFAMPGLARSPPNADKLLAPWFQGLRQPGTGISCCSVADCRLTDFRTQGDHYEAMIDGQWREVPATTILERIENPTGHAVVCYTPARGIMCFVRGPET
jgi:hypothetical protein